MERIKKSTTSLRMKKYRPSKFVGPKAWRHDTANGRLSITAWQHRVFQRSPVWQPLSGRFDSCQTRPWHCQFDSSPSIIGEVEQHVTIYFMQLRGKVTGARNLRKHSTYCIHFLLDFRSWAVNHYCISFSEFLYYRSLCVSLYYRSFNFYPKRKLKKIKIMNNLWERVLTLTNISNSLFFTATVRNFYTLATGRALVQMNIKR